MRFVSFLTCMATAAAYGCGHSPPQQVVYTQATPVFDAPTAGVSHRASPPRAAVAYAAQTFSPRATVSATIELEQKPKSTSQVIDQANRAAAQGPATATYNNAIHEFQYAPGILYQIFSAPNRITDIALEPGEEIQGVPGCGDTIRWHFKGAFSYVDGKKVQHIRIKPAFPGTTTNFVLDTNKRTYLLELHSYELTYMAAVQWSYPQDELASLATQAQQADAKHRDSTTLSPLAKLRFGYKLVTDEDIGWRPTQVFDDGHKTYIVFPPMMLHREAPVLSLIRDGERQLVNYRVKRNWYIVDRLFDRAELRVGQSDPDVVTIVAPTM